MIFIGRITSVPSKDSKSLVGLLTSGTAEAALCGPPKNKNLSVTTVSSGWDCALSTLSVLGVTPKSVPFNSTVNQNTSVMIGNGSNPGTIGMERRRTTNRESNLLNGLSPNFDTTMFNPDSSILSSVMNGSTPNSADIFNMVKFFCFIFFFTKNRRIIFRIVLIWTILYLLLQLIVAYHQQIHLTH